MLLANSYMCKYIAVKKHAFSNFLPTETTVSHALRSKSKRSNKFQISIHTKNVLTTLLLVY